DVWAVGGGYPGYSSGFAIHWDGSAWSTVPTPNANGALRSVAVVAANDVWAVGDASGPLIEHWNGSAWSIVPSPIPGVTTNHLYGVSALAANNVWAVGDTDSEGGGTMMLVEHWDGSAWTQVPALGSPTGRDHFYAVTVTGSGVVWAVGTNGCAGGCTQ